MQKDGRSRKPDGCTKSLALGLDRKGKTLSKMVLGLESDFKEFEKLASVMVFCVYKLI